MHPYRNEPFGFRGPRGSYYGRGNVKFAILELLKEQPRHGYDIIREMEERSGGVYSPSPGVIYPTLQALEDQDFVKSAPRRARRSTPSPSRASPTCRATKSARGMRTAMDAMANVSGHRSRRSSRSAPAAAAPVRKTGRKKSFARPGH